MSREFGPRPDVEHSQSLEEKLIAFSETKQFHNHVESIQVYLESIKQKLKAHTNFFIREPNFTTISYCLGKFFLETPSLSKMLMEHPDRFPNIYNLRGRFLKRVAAILTYENQDKPAIPSILYNLGVESKWEDKIVEILEM